MIEFGIAPEKILKQAGKLQSMVTSIHQIELDLSGVYHDIQSIGGDVSSHIAKSLISCAVSISNEHDKLDDCAEKLSDIAQCYQNAEGTITQMESSLKKTSIVVEGNEIVEESKSHENSDLDSKSEQTDLNEQVGNIENISKEQKDGLRALTGLSLNEIAGQLGTKDGYTVVLFESENVTATYHAELEVPNDISVKALNDEESMEYLMSGDEPEKSEVDIKSGDEGIKVKNDEKKAESSITILNSDSETTMSLVNEGLALAYQQDFSGGKVSGHIQKGNDGIEAGTSVESTVTLSNGEQMKVTRELNINDKGEIVAKYTANKEIEKGVTAKGTFETKVRCSLKPGEVPSAENVPYWDELTVEQQQTLTEGAIINRGTGIHSGHSVEDAIDDWTAQNPGRARLGHAFDPLVGSGGSMPTPAPVGLPGLVPVP